MIRMKPLLDSYYAPYEKHTRYWTGLLLSVRCALYVIFSFDSIGGTDNSLLAIITTFTALIVIAWFSVKIYKSFYVNAIEALVYLNLIILSAATSNKIKLFGTGLFTCWNGICDHGRDYLLSFPSPVHCQINSVA